MPDMIGTLLISASMAAILVAVAGAAPPRLPRLALAAVAGAWVGFAGYMAGAGALSNPLTVLAMFGSPLIAAVALVLFWAPGRRLLAAIPLPLLIGLNVVRLGGALFVLLAFLGRLSGPFPYIAGGGDFLTGALAIPAAQLAASGRNGARSLLAWNAFGMADLIVAVTLGLLSRNGSPLQLIHAGVGTAAMQTLPWAFVPTVLVPLFLVDHGVIFARLLPRQADRGRHGQAMTAGLGTAR